MIDITQEEIMKEWGGDNCDTPLVSIRCITYNQQDYIHQALDGFLIQKTTFPFEIIVHDDASTDKTAEVIREYEAKFPKIIKPIYETENQYSKHNGSLGRIVDAACKGKYIAFCEGDDYWIDENKLQIQIEFLEKNPEYTMCFHNAQIKDELDSSKKISIYENLTEKEYTATELFQNWVVPTASIVMKASCLHFPIKNLLDFCYGDIRIVESCAHLGKVFCINKIMSVYRIQSNGLTWDASLNNKRFRRLPKHFKAIKLNFPLIKKSVVNDKIVESYLLCILKCGNFMEKIKWCFEAFITSPLAVIRNIKYYRNRKSK